MHKGAIVDFHRSKIQGGIDETVVQSLGRVLLNTLKADCVDGSERAGQPLLR